MKRKVKSIRNAMWGAYWKLHDQKKRLVTKLKGYLDGLPPKTRKRIVLTMFAAFAVLALYTFGKAVYDTGRRDGTKPAIEHIRLIELSVKQNNHTHYQHYYDQYGTDED